jgi:hypothetical protein
MIRLAEISGLRWGSAVFDRQQWEAQHLNGQMIRYPGHPLVNATLIMDLYPSLDEASRRLPGKTYPNALGDVRVPGAGCAVYAALDALKLALTRGVDVAKTEANRYWNNWLDQSPEHNREGWRIGQEQAAMIYGTFCSKLNNWQEKECA